MSENNAVKAKRGRKSKKDLMAALGVESYNNPVITAAPVAPVNVIEPSTKVLTSPNSKNITLNIDEFLEPAESDLDLKSDSELDAEVDAEVDLVEQIIKQPLKKRGRKPKGGKIIQQLIAQEGIKIDKPNVILHLKCSMKDLQSVASSSSSSSASSSSNYNNTIEPYAFPLQSGKSNLSYDIIGGEHINKINQNSNSNVKPVNSTYTESRLNNDCENNDDDYDDRITTKEQCLRELWKKLKVLEHDLHINNVNNKKSACFWDTCEFDNPPVYIPKHYLNGTYNVYGCFCCPECAVAYLMNENIDSSSKFERYHLLNHIYSKIYDYTKNIKPSPNPYYMLDKYYGNLTIQEYRSLLRNERLFLIVDKPLTRILPELHDDNDEFILNNKIIPSNNNYQLKTRMQRKKITKNSIVNEKFGGAGACTGPSASLALG